MDCGISQTGQLAANDMLSMSPGGGKKGVSINHLIQFQPRARPKQETHHGTHSRSRINRPGNTKRATMPYNREQFIQANFQQFHVTAGKNYLECLVDPDKLVEWDLVREVVVTTNDSRCPICLGVPVAAKITRCGHVYCWHCILHHLESSDNNWHNCPLCEDFVYSRDLRSVRCRILTPPAPGKKLRMRLLKRHRGSSMPVTAEDWPLAPEGLVETFNSPVLQKDFFKIVPCTLAQAQKVHDRERRELIAEMNDNPPDKFVKQALEIVERLIACTDVPGGGGDDSDASSIDGFHAVRRERTLSTTSSIDSELSESPAHHASGMSWPVAQFAPTSAVEPSSTAAPSPAIPIRRPNASSSPIPPCLSGAAEPEIIAESLLQAAEAGGMWTDDSQGSLSGSEGGVVPPPAHWRVEAAITPVLTEDATPTKEVARAVRPPGGGGGLGGGPDIYSFFMAADGQQVFIHSLNMRCLTKEYGSVDDFPMLLDAKVIEVTRETMETELRARYRYLSHLPLSCEFMICELDLQEYLSPATVRHFAKELGARRTARKKKTQVETKYSRKMQQQEEQQQHDFYQSHTRNPNTIEPEAEVLDWLAARTVGQAAAAPARSSSGAFSAALSGGYAYDLSSSPALNASPMPQSAFPTLGDNLGSPGVPILSTGPWGLGPAAAAPASPSASGGSWGAAKTAAAPPQLVAEEDEGRPPSQQASFVAGVDGALNALSLSATTDTAAGAAGCKKKTKKKKLLLLSTSSQRRN